ncbi:DNA cytosine methyltransferase [Acetobacter sp.]|uniref:DNA cytosine methyltransferase n=1 Tax=Acetobacter sp. TaxID=440 RepID=UPI0039EADB62
MSVYYNEWDKDTAEWLRALIAAGEIPDGFVDTRSIRDVRPEDLVGYRQWHFFAGIGGWPLALRWAGLEGRAGIVTGSPPCQPFSVAGKQLAQDDERHLAPVWLNIVLAIRPELIFGEQVWAAVNKCWIDDLFERAEAAGYACAAAGIPAAGVGAPHQRDRLFFGMADASRELDDGRRCIRKKGWPEHTDGGESCILAARSRAGLERHAGNGDHSKGRSFPAGPTAESGINCRVGNADSERLPVDPLLRENEGGRVTGEDTEAAGAVTSRSVAHANGGERVRFSNGEGREPNRGATRWKKGDRFSEPDCIDDWPRKDVPGWNDVDWLLCRDGKWRSVESGTFPLADGLSKIVGPCSDPSSYLCSNPQAWRTQRLKGYGNAIVPQAASIFIEEFVGTITRFEECQPCA